MSQGSHCPHLILNEPGFCNFHVSPATLLISLHYFCCINPIKDHCMEEGFGNYQNEPIHQKAQEILELTDKVIELIPDDGPMSEYRTWMNEAALTICSKLAGAFAMDLYDLKMENATLIRKSARDLLTICSGLEMMDFKDVDYLQLIRDAIEEFRLLFVDWVTGFDQWDYVIDRWGLFNPPGVNPDDKDPDDDL